MTDQPNPIRRSELPSIPPPEWEFHTWFPHPDGGGDMVPGQRQRGVLVRRRVSCGDWEPVRPDRWADEPETDARAAVSSAGPAPATDRTAVLLEAADIAEDVALRLRGECLLDQVNGAYEVMSELRRMAGEAQQDEAPCCSDPTCACDMVNAAGRCECAKWDDAPAREAQQDPTQDGAEAHPAAVAWKIETPLRGEWRHTGATYDDHAWASERYQDAIENDPDREFRLVRVTTAYTVEAEHNPAAVVRPGQPETEAAAPPA